MSSYLGDKLISGAEQFVGESRNIGQIIPSAIPLTDAGLHLLDGTLIDGSGIYSAFVTYISGLVSTYPDLFTTEADWQTSVSTYGVCGKFVYTNKISATMQPLGTLTGTRNSSSDMDAGSLGMRYAWYVPELSGDIFTVSETPNVGDAIWVYQSGSWTTSGVNIEAVSRTVRLPKVTGILEGTTDVTALGDLVEAGLPNLAGYLRGVGLASNGNDGFSDGVLFSGPQSNEYTRNGGSTYTGAKSTFDASNYNSIYGNSSTVQPQTIKCYYYIVIATSTKTDIQVDIDEIATDLNGKMDTDLNNMSASQSAKNEVISWVMPDYTNGITLSSLPYTVPTDGYIDIAIAALNGTQELFNNNIKIGHAYSSGNSFYSMISGQYKVKQGDIIRSTSNSIQWGAFYPLKGAN